MRTEQRERKTGLAVDGKDRQDSAWLQVGSQGKDCSLYCFLHLHAYMSSLCLSTPLMGVLTVLPVSHIQTSPQGCLSWQGDPKALRWSCRFL